MYQGYSTILEKVEKKSLYNRGVGNRLTQISAAEAASDFPVL